MKYQPTLSESFQNANRPVHDQWPDWPIKIKMGKSRPPPARRSASHQAVLWGLEWRRVKIRPKQLNQILEDERPDAGRIEEEIIDQLQSQSGRPRREIEDSLYSKGIPAFSDDDFKSVT